MEIKSIIGDSKEIFIEGNDISVMINTWASLEGCNLMVHGKDCRLMMAGSFRWEELDMIAAAISIARTA